MEEVLKFLYVVYFDYLLKCCMVCMIECLLGQLYLQKLYEIYCQYLVEELFFVVVVWFFNFDVKFSLVCLVEIFLVGLLVIVVNYLFGVFDGLLILWLVLL